MNLAERALALAADEPDRAALVLLDADNRIAAHWSRGRLRDASLAWSARYKREGFVRGDRIALEVGRDLDAVAKHMGALAAGLTIVPVSSALTKAERADLLAAASLTRGAGSKRDQPDDAIILYTSGTTGRPKGVPLTHANLMANIRALTERWQWSDSDRLLHVLPLHHFHGLVLGLYGSLVVGSEIVLAPRFDARLVLEAVARHGITMLMAVPTMYARMLAEARTGDGTAGEMSLASLRLAVSGSAPLGKKLWQQVRERLGTEVVERYGLTETGIVAANAPGALRAGSVGRLLADVRATIATEAGRVERHAGEQTVRGEIFVAGPSVMRGYDDGEPLSNRDGWFATGDLGYFDADGYLWIDGRLKDLIIVGGANVVPGEVERALGEVDGVLELVAAGLPDADLGEIVAVFAVLATDAEAATVETALRAAADEKLARYKRPRRYRFVKALPRNTMGKIDRARLADTGRG